MNTIKDTINEVIKEYHNNKEAYILEQLNELISRGLLVICETQPIIVRDQYSDKIEIRQSIKLLLKDQEYIVKLETENAQLKVRLQNIEEVINVRTQE